MKKQEELSVLIKSLSASEKRYFRLFCSQVSTGQNSRLLFDFYDASENGGDAELKRGFADQAFTKQLHVAKAYLKKLILKTLRNYHSAASKRAEFYDCLRNIEILFRKELYQLVNVELKKAARLADENDLLAGRVEVENWKRKLHQAQFPYGFSELESILDNQKGAIEQLQNLNEYWHLVLSQQVGPNLVNANLLETADNALTVEAKVLHYNAAYLQNIRKKVEKVERPLYDLLHFLEQNPKRIRNQPGLYISSVNNLVSFHIFRKESQEALELINNTKTFYESISLTGKGKEVLKQVARTLNLELEILRAPQFVQTLGVEERALLFLDKHEGNLPESYKLSFWFQFASVYFQRREWSFALKWINRILNEKFTDPRYDLLIQTRMLNLMVHFEQRNLFVLRYFVDSTRRFVKKVKDIEPYEEVLLRHFSKIGKAPLLEFKPILKSLEEELFPVEEESMVVEDVLDYVNYELWLKGQN